MSAAHEFRPVEEERLAARVVPADEEDHGAAQSVEPSDSCGLQVFRARLLDARSGRPTESPRRTESCETSASIRTSSSRRGRVRLAGVADATHGGVVPSGGHRVVAGGRSPGRRRGARGALRRGAAHPRRVVGGVATPDRSPSIHHRVVTTPCGSGCRGQNGCRPQAHPMRCPPSNRACHRPPARRCGGRGVRARWRETIPIP